MTHCSRLLVLPGLMLVLAASIAAQQPSPAVASPATPAPAVGEVAPDFSFVAASREGLATKPSKLSDYRGQTVVLWLFIKARTRG